MQPITHTQISPSVFFRLHKIFKEQNWEIEEDSVFNDFCRMLSFLNAEQQECVLELTQNFLKIDVGKYLYHIHKALQKIEPEILRNVNTVFIMPLLPKEDYGKSKSSTFLTYFLRGREAKAKEILSVSGILIIDRIDDLKPYINTNNWLLLLVDDFIGSGDTADKAVSDLIDETGIDLEKIAVLTLVSQRIGYERLVAKGIKVFYSELRNRGISDEYPDPKRRNYLDIMLTIENMLKIKEEYQFGYQQSEALVTLNRTPNNTFPVYWRETTIEGKNYIGPFPRR
jgi:hypothetical protein